MKVLVIASHPDDEVLGCGGTLAKHIQNGDDATVLILSPARVHDSAEIYKATEALGINRRYVENLKAQHFETMPQSEIADLITKYIKYENPDIVYTHSKNDVNKDHKVVYEASIVATRPFYGANYKLKAVYGYEVMGSNLQYTQDSKFNPTHFVDVSETLDTKVKAMECYTSELHAYPHPRSKEGIKIYAQFRGLECGYVHAEAFETIKTLS